MTGGTDARRIDQAAKGSIDEHRIDDCAKIHSSQPPQRHALDPVILERVVAWMIDCDDDITVPRESRAEPSELERCAAVTVGQDDERADAGVPVPAPHRAPR